MRTFTVVKSVRHKLLAKKSENVEPITVKCCNCKYWSGQIGSHNEWTREYQEPIKSKVLICAVRICPQPSVSELEPVDGRLAYAKHDCSNFEPRLIMSSSTDKTALE